MKRVSAFSLVLLATLALLPPLPAQVKEIGDVNVTPDPKIKRLFDALGGAWDTSEKRERTQFFPTAAIAQAGQM